MSASLFTRTERSASIFKRITGLIQAGKMKWEERPLWYDAYVANPPFQESDWNVKMPKNGEPIRQIFYEEDLQRASADNSRTIVNIVDTSQKGESHHS